MGFIITHYKKYKTLNMFHEILFFYIAIRQIINKFILLLVISNTVGCNKFCAKYCN